MFDRRNFVSSLLALLPIPFLKGNKAEERQTCQRIGIADWCHSDEILEETLEELPQDKMMIFVDPPVGMTANEVIQWQNETTPFSSEVKFNIKSFVPELIVNFNIESLADGLAILGEAEMARHVGNAVIYELKRNLRMADRGINES